MTAYFTAKGKARWKDSTTLQQTDVITVKVKAPNYRIADLDKKNGGMNYEN